MEVECHERAREGERGERLLGAEPCAGETAEPCAAAGDAAGAADAAGGADRTSSPSARGGTSGASNTDAADADAGGGGAMLLLPPAILRYVCALLDGDGCGRRRPPARALLGAVCTRWRAALRLPSLQPPLSAPHAHVEACEGNIPIILAVGHGGEDAPDAAVCGSRVPSRRRGIRDGDDHTERVLRAVVAEFARHVAPDGRPLRPFFVLGRLRREFADLNREVRLAVESTRLLRYYFAYHDTLEAFADRCARARRQHDTVCDCCCTFLFDVHGQSVERAAVLRGTRNGHTLSAAGFETFCVVSRALCSRGCPVSPCGESAAEIENPLFNGGFTVHRYGCGAACPVDAVQLELGADLRRSAATTAAFARRLVGALLASCPCLLRGQIT